MRKIRLHDFLNFVVKSLHDPNEGRFISRDPIGEAGGLNLYACAHNDPINFCDLLGLCEEASDPGAASGGFGGYFRLAL